MPDAIESPSAASRPLRACNPTPRRLGAARVWTIERTDNISIQHDPPNHKLEFGGSFRVPGCCGRGCGDSRMAVIAMFGKRYSAANQMKRVQRVEDSLAQVWGRAAPNGLPAENIAKLMRSRKNALCRAADSVLRSLRSPRSPVPFVLRRDRHKETRKPEMNPPSPISARPLRTHEWRSRPTAE